MKRYMKIIIAALIGVLLAFIILRFWSMIITQISQHMDMFKRPALIQQALDQEEIDNIHWYGALKRGFTACLALLVILGPSAIIFAWAKAHIERSVVHIFKIGKNEIPVHKRNLPIASQIVMGLTTAEKLDKLDTGIEKAIEIYKAVADLQLRLSRSHALSFPPHVWPALSEPSPPMAFSTPHFRELLDTNQIAPGKPLIMGFDEQGQAQFRAPEDIKSMAVAGWQGSGKTLSTAYLIASILYQYPAAEIFVIDPHRDHPKGLTAIIAPLAASDRLHLVNPVETYQILDTLFQLMDARLSGSQPSDPPVFLVIDELPRLAKSLSDEHFKLFIKFLEAATEETRKTNITFIGAGTKWDARNFKNRKDIRAGMPSLLVHKCKPSQADLLLEDSQEKKLVKALKAPGECLLATSHDADPQLVKMPLITAQDIEHLVTLVANGLANGRPIDEPLWDTRKKPVETTEKPEGVVDLSTFKHVRSGKKPEGDIARKKPAETSVIAALNQQCEQRPTGISKNQWIAALAKATGYSESYTKNILLGNSHLSPEVEDKLIRFLQKSGEPLKKP